VARSRALCPLQFLALYFFLGFAHIALTGGRVLVSLYALHLGASAAVVGSLVGLFALFPMLGGVWIGRWIDRVGVRLPLYAGACAILTGTVLAFGMPHLATMYGAAILIGTGHVIVQVCGQHIVGQLSKDANRAVNYGHLSTSYSIANFCGPTSAGFFIEGVGYRNTFLLYALVSGLCLLLLVARRIAIPEHHPAPRRDGPAGSALGLLREPYMRTIFIVGILQAAAWDLYVFLAPVLGTELNFAPSTIGMILGAFSLGTLVVRLLMPVIHRYVREWQILAISLAIGAVCYLVFPWVGTPLLYGTQAFILGLALGATQPNLLSLMHHAAPSGRGGEALGLRVAFNNGGQVVLPLAFGAASSIVGVTPLFIGFATIFALGARHATAQARRQRHAVPPSS